MQCNGTFNTRSPSRRARRAHRRSARRRARHRRHRGRTAALQTRCWAPAAGPKAAKPWPTDHRSSVGMAVVRPPHPSTPLREDLLEGTAPGSTARVEKGSTLVLYRNSSNGRDQKKVQEDQRGGRARNASRSVDELVEYSCRGVTSRYSVP